MIEDYKSHKYFSEYIYKGLDSVTGKPIGSCKVPDSFIFNMPTYLSVKLALQFNYILGSTGQIIYTSNQLKGYYHDDTNNLIICPPGSYCPGSG